MISACLTNELGLEAGLEPEPEAGYSTASRRGSLAERVMRCSFLGNELGDRPAIMGIFKLVLRCLNRHFAMLRCLPFV